MRCSGVHEGSVMGQFRKITQDSIASAWQRTFGRKQMSASVILSMAGGLGLFLFGMRVMSDSIEKVAGAKLRRILEIFTTNRFSGMIVGIIFTGIIQSSSACTAMVVSFVNAGLMNLYQAAGVIFGANIGTTVTSQLVSFNLSAYAPVILLVGVLTAMFCKKDKIKGVLSYTDRYISQEEHESSDTGQATDHDFFRKNESAETYGIYSHAQSNEYVVFGATPDLKFGNGHII